MSTSWSSWTTPIAPSTRTSRTPASSRGRRQPVPQPGLDPLDLLRASPGRAAGRSRRGDGRGERVAHEGRAVGQHRHLAAARCPSATARGAQRRRHRQIAAGQRLAHAHHIRGDRRRARPRTARPCGRSRWRSRRTPAARRARRTPRAAPADSAGEWNRIPPAPCTTGSTITAASSSACRAISSRSCAAYAASGSASKPAGGASAKTCRGSTPLPQLVHPAVRVAHRHRLPGVAVVAAAPGQQPLLARAGRASASTAGTS